MAIIASAAVPEDNPLDTATTAQFPAVDVDLSDREVIDAATRLSAWLRDPSIHPLMRAGVRDVLRRTVEEVDTIDFLVRTNAVLDNPDLSPGQKLAALGLNPNRPLTAPPCPSWCTECINADNDSGTDPGTAWHRRPLSVVDDACGDDVTVTAALERCDGPNGIVGNPLIHIAVTGSGSLSPAKAREHAAHLVALADIAEQVER